MSDLSPIACEVCRTKKRKVSVKYYYPLFFMSLVLMLLSSVIARCECEIGSPRDLVSNSVLNSPTCSQCAHANQTCTYPGTSKRYNSDVYRLDFRETMADNELSEVFRQAISQILKKDWHKQKSRYYRLLPSFTDQRHDMSRIQTIWQGQPHKLRDLESSSSTRHGLPESKNGKDSLWRRRSNNVIGCATGLQHLSYRPIWAW